MTPLHVAAVSNAPEVAAVLIEHGADINAKGLEGHTPLHLAAWHNAREVAEVLIEHGANIHAKDMKGETSLAIAGRENAQGVLAVLRKRQAALTDLLAGLDVGDLRNRLGRELSPTAVDENGWTDLHYAAALNLPELAGMLLDNGADVAVRLKDDEEPLSDQLKQSLDALELELHFTWRLGFEPLHLAAIYNAPEAAAVLIERGADVHAKDEYGWALLHFAAIYNTPGGCGGAH